MNNWFAQAPAWVRYRAWQDLYHKPQDHIEVRTAYQEMLADPDIQSLFAKVNNWPGEVLKSHKDSSHALHALVFLSDLGLRRTDAGISEIAEKVFATFTRSGIPQMNFQVPAHFGGSGQPQSAWMICDAPLVLSALARFGYANDPRVLAGTDQLIRTVRENGWPCVVSEKLAPFRGPGRKEDPCPYATLLMLQLLTNVPGGMQTDAFQTGVETLFTFWQERKNKKMYLFGIGTDFMKLKAPFVWFDLLHVTEVLSRVPALQGDPRLLELVNHLRDQKDRKGRFKAESIYLPWKDWEFGQKKRPSYWITFLSWRIIRRIKTAH